MSGCFSPHADKREANASTWSKAESGAGSVSGKFGSCFVKYSTISVAFRMSLLLTNKADRSNASLLVVRMSEKSYSLPNIIVVFVGILQNLQFRSF